MSKSETSERHRRELLNKLEEHGFTYKQYREYVALFYCIAVIVALVAFLLFLAFR